MLLMSMWTIENTLDILLMAIYNIAISNIIGGDTMSKAQEELITCIENINDNELIERIHNYILFMLSQKSTKDNRNKSNELFP